MGRLVAVIVVASALVATSGYSVGTYRASMHLDRARQLVPLGRYDAALAELTRASALTPGDARVARERGRVNHLLYAFRGDERYARDALAALRTATDLNPLDGHNYYELGRVSLMLGRAKQAEEAFLEALRRDPYNVAYLVSLGDLYQSQGQLRRARGAYLRARDVRQDALVESKLRSLPEY